MTAVVDENHQELTFELIDVKSLANSDLDDIVPNHSNSLDEENDYLKKEMKLLQEKCTILQAQVQHQSKLIELLIRLDMLKSYEDPDQKDLEDLHKKIHLCTNLTEEYAIKFQEICNEKRRILIPDNSHEPEKKSAIWDHFTVIINSEGAKTVRCNYCHKVFNHKQMNTNKCREHILEKCDEAPESLRTKHKFKSEPQVPKSKYSVWNHFTSTERDDRLFIVCSYCGIEYSSKNATKCREHLAFKCTKITDEARSEMRSTFSQEYIDALLNTTKRSTIWEHFCVYEDDDHKTMIQCIYCCMNYANKNATKCREHLLERCDKVPLSIQHQIRDSLYETPSKTWTQIKIPIWKHFSVMNLKDRKQYKCDYCKKIYASKNVTKFRLHLLYKCESIPEDVRTCLNEEVSNSGTKTGAFGDNIVGNNNHSLIFEDADNDNTNDDEDDEIEPNPDEEDDENIEPSNVKRLKNMKNQNENLDEECDDEENEESRSSDKQDMNNEDDNRHRKHRDITNDEFEEQRKKIIKRIKKELT